jgi:hypothetical protein
MQAVEVLKAAPVAAVEGACADQIEGGGDDVVAVLGQHQEEALAHRLADRLEEGQREGRDPAAFVEGVAIEAMEGGPFGLGDLVPGMRRIRTPDSATRRRSRLTFLRFSAVKAPR